MSTIEIILTILSSSILTTLLTLGGGWYFRKTDYKNDYFKEIIKRRLNGYEELERTASLFIQTYRISTGKCCHIIFYYGYNEFLNYWNQISNTVRYSVWVNEKTLELLSAMLNIIHETDKKHNLNENSTDEEVILAGIGCYDVLFKLTLELENAMREDMLNLYKVEEHLKIKYDFKKRI